MISITIDANIIFSASYNKEGLERKLINFILEKEDIQLFAPDIYKEEVSRNLEKNLNFTKERIEEHLNDFEIITVPFEKYKKKIPEAKELILHQKDIPYIAVALFLNSIIWSGNEKHFQHLDNSKDIIWFNSRKLLAYLKDKDLLTNKKR